MLLCRYLVLSILSLFAFEKCPLTTVFAKVNFKFEKQNDAFCIVNAIFAMVMSVLCL